MRSRPSSASEIASYASSAGSAKPSSCSGTERPSTALNPASSTGTCAVPYAATSSAGITAVADRAL